jgi:hypothetical protein
MRTVGDTAEKLCSSSNELAEDAEGVMKKFETPNVVQSPRGGEHRHLVATSYKSRTRCTSHLDTRLRGGQKKWHTKPRTEAQF